MEYTFKIAVDRFYSPDNFFAVNGFRNRGSFRIYSIICNGLQSQNAGLVSIWRVPGKLNRLFTALWRNRTFLYKKKQTDGCPMDTRFDLLAGYQWTPSDDVFRTFRFYSVYHFDSIYCKSAVTRKIF